MPRSAIRHVVIDHCLPLSGISALLSSLSGTRGAKAPVERVRPAASGGRGMTAEYKLDDPVAVTCPDCGGALRRTELGTLTQFRCHIGHVYTAEVMVAAQFAAMEWSLDAATRALSERGELCRQMADKARGDGDGGTAAQWDAAMHEAKERTGVLRELCGRRWTHPRDVGLPATSAG